MNLPSRYPTGRSNSALRQLQAEIDELYQKATALPWYAVNQRLVLIEAISRRFDDMLPMFAQELAETPLGRSLLPPF